MLRLLSHAEQVAAHLREGLLRGRWQGAMPGVAKLEAELGVNHTTMNHALALLEEDGLLVSQGDRKRRRIVLPEGSMAAGLRVGILLYEQADNRWSDFNALRHALISAGFSVVVPDKTLTELDMDVRKIAKVARANEVDAWVVVSASHTVLEWFADQSVPAIAWCGRYPPGNRIASVAPGRESSMNAAIQRLVSLGHHRIVMLTGGGGQPAYFTKALESHGIEVGSYHVPALERTPDGLRRCLGSIYSLTPPTALLIDEACIFLPVKDELAQRSIFAPRDVSLICMDYHTMFDWYRPTVAHIRWDMAPLNRRIISWVTNVSRGKDDRKATFTRSVFVDGGTVGPVAVGR